MSQSDWDKLLRECTLNLVPTSKEIKDAKATADRIIRTLQQNGRYSVDRSAIVGSLAKKTAISYPNSQFDVDCVAIINNITQKDFSAIFENFATHLKRNGINCKIPKTGIAMKATVGRFDIDIVPAINYDKNDEIQRQKAWEALKKASMGDRYSYSSSLSYYQVKFIRTQSAYVHDLIRLGKLWSKKMPISEYINGKSTLFELIAVQAGNLEEGSTRSLYRGFCRFLEMVKNFHGVCICFYNFYSQSEVPKSIREQRPLVLDPSNPFNNMAYDVFKRKRHLIKQIEGHAEKTLREMMTGKIGLGVANLV